MRKLPTDPLAFHTRIMDALIADIQDRDATTFQRLDALRHLSQQTPREPVVTPNKRAGRFS